MLLSRYFYTLRYLRPVQIYGRLWFRLNPAKPDVRAAPPLRLLSGKWLCSAERPSSMRGSDTFQFLNVVGHARCVADWNDLAREKLWLYNLHYFDDLNAADAKDRVEWHRALISRWIVENLPGVGNGWESYPTSLRIVNWIKWAQAGNSLDQAWLHSLAVQVRWLRRRIEWHLQGNHLFANAKALVFAGLFFEGDEAAEWMQQGLKILRREVPEQVLADGGHFELSPMYHAIILEDMLDLVNAASVWPEQIPESAIVQWRGAVSRMLRWLEGMIHPDGGIAFFNDAALGIAPDYAELRAYAGRLGIAPAPDKSVGLVTHFADSGYIRLARSNAVALLDVASVGPDYLPGHAHADSLSFELSLFRQRVVVNSGISQYGSGPERLRQRGTAVHSTVQVDGVDSSEVWGGFRVARRAKPFDLEIAEEGDALIVRCAHDGYRRLRGRPVHRRSWKLAEHSLKVVDMIEGHFHEAVARYFFHPAVVVTGEEKEGLLHLPEGQVVRWSVAGGAVCIVSASWHSEFGLSVPCSRIEVLFTGPQASIEFVWN